MPTTSLGLRYPSSTDDVRPYEDIQFLATDVDTALTQRAPIAETVALSSQYTLTASVADLPGCTITKTTPRANCVALITWMADCQLFTLGTASLMAVINAMVDGVDQAAPQSVWGPGNQSVQTNTRGTTAGSMVVVLASAGSHTFKLRAAKASASGDIKLNTQATSMTVVIL